MAIYVQLEARDWNVLASAYGLTLQRTTGIPQGSINSNFRVEAVEGRYFLRHTTVRSASDLQFEAQFLGILNAGGFPAPTLVKTRDHHPFFEIAGGRASLFKYLSGEELSRGQLTPLHLERLGQEVGKLHRLGQSFVATRSNPYGLDVVGGWLLGLRTCPDVEVQATLPLLNAALAEARALLQDKFHPQGAIHSDIFLDNVKWLGDRVSAVFDFEMACVDAYALDLAITLNAWCFDKQYQTDLVRSLVQGYVGERPLSELERTSLHAWALFGAVRYTASRIRDFHLSSLPPEKLTKKDFRTYRSRVEQLTNMGAAGFDTLVFGPKSQT